MMNAIRKSILWCLFLLLSYNTWSQKVTHSFSTSILTWFGTNTQEFPSQISKEYVDGFNIPKFNYRLTYKNKYVLGLNNFYSTHRKTELSKPTPIGKLQTFNLSTIILYAGIKKDVNKNIEISPSIGLAFFGNEITSYYVDYVRIWDPTTCYINRNVQLNFAMEVNYYLNCGMFFGLNARFFPMIKSLPNDCKFKVYERIQILMGQLNVGYSF